MSAERRAIKALALKFGVEVEFTPDGCDAYAPSGIAFNATGCHALVVERWDDDTLRHARRSFLTDLRKGVAPCENVPCDACGRYDK